MAQDLGLTNLPAAPRNGVFIKGNFDGPGLGIELDDNLIENERNAPEWEFPARSDSFDSSVLDH